MWSAAFYDLCTPHSSSADDAVRGRWVRVDRDLNMQAGMWHLVRLPRAVAR
jgi:hypothetical protein